MVINAMPYFILVDYFVLELIFDVKNIILKYNN